jgi:hypothetical protein
MMHGNFSGESFNEVAGKSCAIAGRAADRQLQHAASQQFKHNLLRLCQKPQGRPCSSTLYQAIGGLDQRGKNEKKGIRAAIQLLKTDMPVGIRLCNLFFCLMLLGISPHKYFDYKQSQDSIFENICL